MKEDEFYVGYHDKAPRGVSRLVRRVIFVALAALLLVSFIVVNQQRGFPNSNFELADRSRIEGVIYTDPQPFIRARVGKDAYGNPLFKNVLLINYGKFGATESVQKMQDKLGGALENFEVTLEGKWIYYDGFSLFELSDNENSLVDHIRTATIDQNRYHIGVKALEGQIIDPKCYFGAMKPGEGKPHRSCAVLCISGGIPPVFAAKDGSGRLDYYLMLNKNGQPVNQAVLDFVAEPLVITGEIAQVNGWKVIYFEPGEDIQRL